MPLQIASQLNVPDLLNLIKRSLKLIFNRLLAPLQHILPLKAQPNSHDKLPRISWKKKKKKKGETEQRQTQKASSVVRFLLGDRHVSRASLTYDRKLEQHSASTLATVPRHPRSVKETLRKSLQPSNGTMSSAPIKPVVFKLSLSWPSPVQRRKLFHVLNPDKMVMKWAIFNFMKQKIL